MSTPTGKRFVQAIAPTTSAMFLLREEAYRRIEDKQTVWLVDDEGEFCKLYYDVAEREKSDIDNSWDRDTVLRLDESGEAPISNRRQRADECPSPAGADRRRAKRDVGQWICLYVSLERHNIVSYTMALQKIKNAILLGDPSQYDQ